jgi:hypothetical protein
MQKSLLRRAKLDIVTIPVILVAILTLAACEPDTTLAPSVAAQPAPPPLVPPAVAAVDPTHWIADANTQCWVHDPFPQQGESIVWHGTPCNDDVASGNGEVDWHNASGELVEADNGTYASGLEEGPFIIQHYDGNGNLTRTDTGTYKDDLPAGKWTDVVLGSNQSTWTHTQNYENGKPSGPNYIDAAFSDNVGKYNSSYEVDVNGCPIGGGKETFPDGTTHRQHWVVGVYPSSVLGYSTAALENRSNCRANNYTLVNADFNQASADAAEQALQTQQAAQQQQQQAQQAAQAAQQQAQQQAATSCQQSCSAQQDQCNQQASSNSISGMLGAVTSVATGMESGAAGQASVLQSTVGGLQDSSDCTSAYDQCSSSCPQ